MRIKNFELLDCAFRQPLEKTKEFIEGKSLPGHIESHNEKKTNNSFCSLLLDYYDLLVLRHWMIPSSISPAETVALAGKLVLEYYSTEWYVGDKYEQKEMTKSPTNETFEDSWYRFYRKALFFALVSNEKTNLTLISNWSESWFVPSRMLPIDPMWARILVFVTASFRSSPLEGQGELRELIEGNAEPGPRELFESWKSALSQDQSGFENQLLISIEEFEKKLPKKPCNIDDPIAEIHSIVLAAARALGMEVPAYKEKTMARLLTPESVGLVG